MAVDSFKECNRIVTLNVIKIPFINPVSLSLCFHNIFIQD